jgi:hypothetical protein
MSTPKVEALLEDIETTSRFLHHGWMGVVLFDLLHRRPHPYTRHQLEVHLRKLPWSFNEETLDAEPCGNCLAYGYSEDRVGGKEGFCCEDCEIRSVEGVTKPDDRFVKPDDCFIKPDEAVVQEWLSLFDLVDE